MTVGAIIEICSDEYPAGVVIDQIPEGGNIVEIGSIVDLVVSCGPCTTILDIIGLTYQEAEQVLLNNNLLLGQVVEICNDEYPEGYVFKQEPSAMEEFCYDPNTNVIPVSIWVSTGPCGEGIPEGTSEGTPEGIPEGTVEGTPEGVEEGVIEGIPEGTVEGTPEGTFEGEFSGVRGQVINSISKKPVSGVLVQISIADIKGGNAPILTDENGHFAFPDLGSLQPPYRLDFTKRKYKPKTIQPVEANAYLLVELEPGNIQKPLRPRPYGGPRNVRITWDTNPEYNIAGYNIYRRTVDKSGNPLSDWQRLNNPDSLPYENYLTSLEYLDSTVELGVYYQYAVQAVSDVDRYTILSDPSEIVRGQYLTIFFPEQVSISNNSPYWFFPDPQNPEDVWLRIPVNSKSVYDVSTTSIQIDSELPSALISDPSSITVLPSGITTRMLISAFPIPQGETINVRIASSDLEAESLYGAGTLFNILVKPNLSSIESCGPLHLIPDDGLGNGVRLYDVISSWTKPLELILEDGELCITEPICIYGDANNDRNVDDLDSQYILDFWTNNEAGDICIQKSGDINMDGTVDSADSSMLQRWLTGQNITPPTEEVLNSKSYNEYIRNLTWLADTGSMSAESLLAKLEKADESIYVQLSDNLIGSAGTEKWISVLAENANNVAGFSMVINFDKEYAEVLEVSLGDTINNMKLSYNVNANTTGSLRIAGSSTESIGVKGTIDLVKILFRMKQTGNAEITLSQIQINDKYAYVPMFDDPKSPKIIPLELPTEGEGTTEGTGEGALEGSPEGIIEGLPEGTTEGTPEGITEGVIEGEGTTEGTNEGTPDGEPQVDKVKIPDVVGKTKAEAESEITSAGLIIGIITEEYSNTVPVGKVIRTNPTAGTEVNKGSKVDLVISRGKEKRKFIVSCGTNNSNNSNFGDLLVMIFLITFLLTQYNNIKHITKRSEHKN